MKIIYSDSHVSLLLGEIGNQKPCVCPDNSRRQFSDRFSPQCFSVLSVMEQKIGLGKRKPVLGYTFSNIG